MNTTVFLSSYWDKISGAMAEAVPHTVIGILVVSGALLLFTFTISLFKYISVIENKLKERKEGKKEIAEAPAQAIENTVAQIAEAEAVELSDDLALVAVITAAIHAYEEANGNAAAVANGLVVRSIRRAAAKTSWKNA